MASSRGRLRLSPRAAAAPQLDAGKYVRYTAEQVEALERAYGECPKPSSLRRQQLIRDCPVLTNVEPRQIKVWFQNRRSVKLLALSALANAMPFVATLTCLFRGGLKATGQQFCSWWRLAPHSQWRNQELE